MIKAKRTELLLILGLLLAVAIINMPALYTYFYHEITGAPEAVNGILDLSDYNKKNYLDGQWEFYWQKFIATERDVPYHPDLLIEVPDEWSRYQIGGQTLSELGYGSYRLTINGIKYENDVSLYIPDFGGAYRIFIDGQLASESGTVSKDIDEIFTTPSADLYPVSLSENSSHDIVVEVATTRFSGLYMTPVLVDYNETVNENLMRNAVRFILFGIVLFAFLSLFALYVLCIRRKLQFFWMPIMIFFIILRTMLTTEFYSFWQPIFFLNLSYESTNELMYLVTFILKFIMIFLVQEECGITFCNKEKIGFFLYYAMLYFTYLLMPQDIYNQYMSVQIPMLSYVLDIYLFFKIYRGREKLRRFGMAVFWSVVLVMAGLAVDSYYINGKIYMNMSMTMLLFFTVFALTMSCVYAMRSADMYDDFTVSSSRLEMANGQIEKQKDYYKALSGQINEIREIKHDIRHFVGTFRFLADEGDFDKLKDFLSEYGGKTEMDQLPVFCENTIANSIIGYYHLQAKKFGIKFESRCSISEQTIINDSDICIILGNALENAADACRKIENPEERIISVEAVRMKGQQLIKVINSYDGIIKMSEDRYISSKGGKSHGLGISSIKRIVESYGGFLKIEHDQDKFTIYVAVPESI
jgi:hypothetical protein